MFAVEFRISLLDALELIAQLSEELRSLAFGRLIGVMTVTFSHTGVRFIFDILCVKTIRSALIIPSEVVYRCSADHSGYKIWAWVSPQSVTASCKHAGSSVGPA